MHLTHGAALSLVVSAAVAAPAADGPARREWTIDGTQRVALVAAPATVSTNPPPLVFVFHGHGGSMEGAVRMFHIHDLWPEAVVVYPQGLNTPGRLTDPEGKRPGWQSAVGAQGDRDLRFFDAMLETMRKSPGIDTNRVYSTGHSNGGGFTYLLWLARGDRLAAIAPSAAAKARGAEAEKPPRPLPVMHIGGTADPLVKFEWQRASMDAVRAFNRCGEGKPWGPMCTQYVSKVGAPLVEYIHPGTHKFPPEAPPRIVAFFQEHRRPAPGRAAD